MPISRHCLVIPLCHADFKRHLYRQSSQREKRRRTDASLPQRDIKEKHSKVCFVMPISRGICTDKANKFFKIDGCYTFFDNFAVSKQKGVP